MVPTSPRLVLELIAALSIGADGALKSSFIKPLIDVRRDRNGESRQTSYNDYSTNSDGADKTFYASTW
jgi:hypothetical protein